MSKPLRLGVIGVGSVVREIYHHLWFASDYAPLVTIEAVAETDEQALHTFCDSHGIAKPRRFSDYRRMIEACELDAVQCNTPDALHEEPCVFALSHGLDVLVPKPLADSTAAGHRMIAAARVHDRLLLVDFHKRHDPRVREAAARYRAGRYGTFQWASWSMMDRLEVADPNREPRFFATADFAERNTPISFLTVHMADALMWIIRQRPVRVRAHAWAQKLPRLAPLAVQGYDMCDTEVEFEHGGIAHIVTGWHLPDTAPALTVHTTRTVCSDGVFELLDGEGFEELTAEGVRQPGALFRQFDPDGTVRGYGMSYPGELLRTLVQQRDGQLTPSQRAAMMTPLQLGFWATAVVEAAHTSLERGRPHPRGIIHGVDVELPQLLRARLGDEAEAYLT